MPHSNDSSAERFMQGDLALWRVRTPHGEALIAEQGAQLLSYTPHGQPPLVWLSPEASYERGVSLRGGVPVCWPWFGDLDRNPAEVRANVASAYAESAPKHGFARIQDWGHVDTAFDAEGVTLVFRLDVTGESPKWGHPARLTLRIRLADAITLELGVCNLSDSPLTISQALHTYFAVSDVRDITISGVEGKSFVDTLDQWHVKTQGDALQFTGETDRLYLGLDQPLTIRDPGWARDIVVQSSHSRSAVIWNPWIEKAKRIDQFPDHAWQGMVCIETARVWDDVLTIAPGDTAFMAAYLRVVPH